jgi:drug/metabolite transporter (DMT)-like permease
MLRQMGPDESPEAIALHFSLVAASVLTTIGLLHLTSIPDARTVLTMLAAGACGGFAQLAMTRAYALERAARVSGMAYLQVVVSTLLGAVALHEWPTGRTVGGMALIVSGGLVVAFTGLRQARQARAGRVDRDDPVA